METLIRNTEARSLYWKQGAMIIQRERLIGLVYKNKHFVKKRGKEALRSERNWC